MATNSDVYYAASLEQCNIDRRYRYSFGDIVGKDSPGKSFGFDNRLLKAECIDSDKVEADRCGSNERTMDLIMGLADFNDVKQKYTRQYLLPIELKLNCVAFNEKLKSLKEKDKHTREMIDGIFSENSVFIFTDNVAKVATSYYHRWRKGSEGSDIKNWRIVTPNQFNSLIKFSADFPYTPQTNFNAISKAIDTFIEGHDIDGCYNYIETYIWKMVESFGVKDYNKNEVTFLSVKLKDKAEEVFEILDEDEKEYLMIALNKILYFSNSL